MKTKLKNSFSPLLLLCALCIVSLSIMVFSIYRTINHTYEEAYTPPPFDSAALVGSPQVPDNLGFSPLEIEQGYSVYLCANLTIQNGFVPVYFTSPESNTVWLRLRILTEDGRLLCETGIIKPGEYIKSVRISNSPTTQIPVNLEIIACRPDTYTSMGTAGLNTVLNPDVIENGKG